MLWTKISSLFELSAEPEASEDDVAEAIAVLLIHAGRIDGHEDEDEKARRDGLLTGKFGLAPEELQELTEKAGRLDDEAVDLYRFTSVLTKSFDQDGRKHIVRMLWEIVLADGVVTDYEANFMWRAAELLGVSTRDRVNLRKSVEASLPGDPAGAE
ncbi:MAG: TerB family tellurite resistance protein [Pseudomonadota bacterium]